MLVDIDYTQAFILVLQTRHFSVDAALALTTYYVDNDIVLDWHQATNEWTEFECRLDCMEHFTEIYGDEIDWNDIETIEAGCSFIARSKPDACLIPLDELDNLSKAEIIDIRSRRKNK